LKKLGCIGLQHHVRLAVEDFVSNCWNWLNSRVAVLATLLATAAVQLGKKSG